jgi:hypothetical protein
LALPASSARRISCRKSCTIDLASSFCAVPKKQGPWPLFRIGGSYVLKQSGRARISIPVHNQPMNKKIIGTLALVALLVYGAWDFFNTPTAKRPVLPSTTAVAANTGATSASFGTTSSPPASPSPSAATVNKVIGPPRSAAALEFEKGKNLRQFYDRYMANPEGADAETKYLAAAAIEACAGRSRAQQGPTEAEKQRFISRLKENDPNNQQRIDAFTQVTTACDGFQGLNLTGADASRLFKEAALAGNPAAKVAWAAEQFRETSRGATGVEQRRLTEDQLALVRDGLASGDPFAIQRAGNLLSYGSTQLADRRLGQDGTPFTPRDLAPAFTFAACDHGGSCGADNTRVLNGCAYQGACGYQSLEAYMQFNELAPNTYVAAQQNRTMINDAISQGRWDLLGIAPGMGRTATTTPPAGNTAATGGGRTATKPGG